MPHCPLCCFFRRNIRQISLVQANPSLFRQRGVCLYISHWQNNTYSVIKRSHFLYITKNQIVCFFIQIFRTGFNVVPGIHIYKARNCANLNVNYKARPGFGLCTTNCRFCINIPFRQKQIKHFKQDFLLPGSKANPRNIIYNQIIIKIQKIILTADSTCGILQLCTGGTTTV